MKMKKACDGADLKVLSREEILKECEPLKTEARSVIGWSGKIRMKNISFNRLVELKLSAPDSSSYPAMLVAEVCEDLSIEDAIKLQNGNGFKFATLYAAVEEYGNSACKAISDEKIKN